MEMVTASRISRSLLRPLLLFACFLLAINPLFAVEDPEQNSFQPTVLLSSSSPDPIALTNETTACDGENQPASSNAPLAADDIMLLADGDPLRDSVPSARGDTLFLQTPANIHFLTTVPSHMRTYSNLSSSDLATADKPFTGNGYLTSISILNPTKNQGIAIVRGASEISITGRGFGQLGDNSASDINLSNGQNPDNGSIIYGIRAHVPVLEATLTSLSVSLECNSIQTATALTGIDLSAAKKISIQSGISQLSNRSPATNKALDVSNSEGILELQGTSLSVSCSNTTGPATSIPSYGIYAANLGPSSVWRVQSGTKILVSAEPADGANSSLYGAYVTGTPGDIQFLDGTQIRVTNKAGQGATYGFLLQGNTAAPETTALTFRNQVDVLAESGTSRAETRDVYGIAADRSRAKLTLQNANISVQARDGQTNAYGYAANQGDLGELTFQESQMNVFSHSKLAVGVDIMAASSAGPRRYTFDGGLIYAYNDRSATAGSATAIRIRPKVDQIVSNIGFNFEPASFDHISRRNFLALAEGTRTATAIDMRGLFSFNTQLSGMVSLVALSKDSPGASAVGIDASTAVRGSGDPQATISLGGSKNYVVGANVTSFPSFGSSGSMAASYQVSDAGGNSGAAIKSFRTQINLGTGNLPTENYLVGGIVGVDTGGRNTTVQVGRSGGSASQGFTAIWGTSKNVKAWDLYGKLLLKDGSKEALTINHNSDTIDSITLHNLPHGKIELRPDEMMVFHLDSMQQDSRMDGFALAKGFLEMEQGASLSFIKSQQGAKYGKLALKNDADPAANQLPTSTCYWIIRGPGDADFSSLITGSLMTVDLEKPQRIGSLEVYEVQNWADYLLTNDGSYVNLTNLKLYWFSNSENSGLVVGRARPNIVIHGIYVGNENVSSTADTYAVDFSSAKGTLTIGKGYDIYVTSAAMNSSEAAEKNGRVIGVLADGSTKSLNFSGSITAKNTNASATSSTAVIGVSASDTLPQPASDKPPEIRLNGSANIVAEADGNSLICGLGMRNSAKKLIADGGSSIILRRNSSVSEESLSRAGPTNAGDMTAIDAQNTVSRLEIGGLLEVTSPDRIRSSLYGINAAGSTGGIVLAGPPPEEISDEPLYRLFINSKSQQESIASSHQKIIGINLADIPKDTNKNKTTGLLDIQNGYDIRITSKSKGNPTASGLTDTAAAVLASNGTVTNELRLASNMLVENGNPDALPSTAVYGLLARDFRGKITHIGKIDAQTAGNSRTYGIDISDASDQDDGDLIISGSVSAKQLASTSNGTGGIYGVLAEGTSRNITFLESGTITASSESTADVSPNVIGLSWTKIKNAAQKKLQIPSTASISALSKGNGDGNIGGRTTAIEISNANKDAASSVEATIAGKILASNGSTSETLSAKVMGLDAAGFMGNLALEKEGRVTVNLESAHGTICGLDLTGGGALRLDAGSRVLVTSHSNAAYDGAADDGYATGIRIDRLTKDFTSKGYLLVKNPEPINANGGNFSRAFLRGVSAKEASLGLNFQTLNLTSESYPSDMKPFPAAANTSIAEDLILAPIMVLSENGANVIGLDASELAATATLTMESGHHILARSNVRSAQTEGITGIVAGVDISKAKAATDQELGKHLSFSNTVSARNFNPQADQKTRVYGIRADSAAKDIVFTADSKVFASTVGKGMVYGIEALIMDKANFTFDGKLVAESFDPTASENGVYGIRLDGSRGTFRLGTDPNTGSIRSSSKSTNGSDGKAVLGLSAAGLGGLETATSLEIGSPFSINAEGNFAEAGQVCGARISLLKKTDRTLIGGTIGAKNSNGSSANAVKVIGLDGSGSAGPLTIGGQEDNKGGKITATAAGQSDLIGLLISETKDGSITLDKSATIEVVGHNGRAASGSPRTIGIYGQNAGEFISSGKILVQNGAGTAEGTGPSLLTAGLVLEHGTKKVTLKTLDRLQTDYKNIGDESQLAEGDINGGPIAVESKNGGTVIGLSLGGDGGAKNDLDIQNGHHIVVRGSAARGTRNGAAVGDGAIVGVAAVDLSASAGSQNRLSFGSIISARNLTDAADSTTEVVGIFAPNCRKEIAVPSTGSIFATSTGRSQTSGMDLRNSSGNLSFAGRLLSKNGTNDSSGPVQVQGINADGAGGHLDLIGESIDKPAHIMAVAGSGDAIGFGRRITSGSNDPSFHIRIANGRIEAESKGASGIGEKPQLTIGLDLDGKDSLLQSAAQKNQFQIMARNVNGQADANTSVYGIRVASRRDSQESPNPSPILLSLIAPSIQATAAGASNVVGIDSQGGRFTAYLSNEDYNLSTGFEANAMSVVSKSTTAGKGTKIFGLLLDNSTGGMAINGPIEVSSLSTAQNGPRVVGVSRHFVRSDQFLDDDGFTLEESADGGLTVDSKARSGDGSTSGMAIGFDVSGGELSRISLAGPNSITNSNTAAESSTSVIGVRGQNFQGILDLLDGGTMTVGSLGMGSSIGADLSGVQTLLIQPTFLLKVAGHNYLTDSSPTVTGRTIGVNLSNTAGGSRLESSGFIVVENRRPTQPSLPTNYNGSRADSVAIDGTGLANESALEFTGISLNSGASQENVATELRSLPKGDWIANDSAEVTYGTIHLLDENGGNAIGINLAGSRASVSMGQNNNLSVRGMALSAADQPGRGRTVGIDYSNVLPAADGSGPLGNLILQNVISVRNLESNADSSTTVHGIFADGSQRSITLSSGASIFASAAGNSKVYGIHATETTQALEILGNVSARNSTVLINGAIPSEVYGLDFDGAAGTITLGTSDASRISADGRVLSGAAAAANGGSNVVAVSRLERHPVEDPAFQLRSKTGCTIEARGNLSTGGHVVGVDLSSSNSSSTVQMDGIIVAENCNLASDGSATLCGLRARGFDGHLNIGEDGAIEVMGAGDEAASGIIAEKCRGLSVQGKMELATIGKNVTGAAVLSGARLDETEGSIVFGSSQDAAPARTMHLISKNSESSPTNGAALCGIHWHTNNPDTAGSTLTINKNYSLDLESAINSDEGQIIAIDLEGPNDKHLTQIQGKITARNVNQSSSANSSVYGIFGNDYHGKIELADGSKITLDNGGNGSAYGIFCDGATRSASDITLRGSLEIQSSKSNGSSSGSTLYGVYVSRTGGPITCVNGSQIKVLAQGEKNGTGLHITGNSSTQNILLEEGSTMIIRGRNSRGGNLTAIDIDDSNANISLKNWIAVDNGGTTNNALAYGFRAERSSGKVSFDGNNYITVTSSATGSDNSTYGVYVNGNESTDEDAINAKIGNSCWSVFASSATGNATAFSFDTIAGGGVDLGGKAGSSGEDSKIILTGLAGTNRAGIGLQSNAKTIRIHGKNNYIVGLSGNRGGSTFSASPSPLSRAILLTNGASLELGTQGSTNHVIGGIQSSLSGSGLKPTVTFQGTTRLWGKSEGVQTWNVKGSIEMMSVPTFHITDAYLNSTDDNLKRAPLDLNALEYGKLTLRAGEMLQFHLEKDGDRIQSMGTLHLKNLPNSSQPSPQLIFDGGKIAARSLSVGIADLTKELELELVKIDQSWNLSNYGNLMSGMTVGDLIKGRENVYSIENEADIFDCRLSSYVEEKELHLAFSTNPGKQGLVLIKIPDTPEDLIGRGTCCVKTSTKAPDITINLGNGSDVPQLTNPDYYLKDDGSVDPFEEKEGFILRFKTAGEKAVWVSDSVDGGSIEFRLNNTSPAIEVINDNLSTKVIGLDASKCKSNLIFTNDSSQRPLKAAYDVEYPTDFLNTAIALRNSMPSSASYGLSVDRALGPVLLDKNCDINVESKSLYSDADTIGITAEGSNGLKLSQNTIASNFNAYSSGKVYGIYAKNSAGPIRTDNASISAISYGSGTVCGINAEMGTEEEVDLRTSGKCNIFAYNGNASGSAVGLMATSSCEKGSVVLGDQNQAEKVCVIGLNGMAHEGEQVTCGISAYGSLTPISLQASRNCIVGLSGNMESKKFNDLRFRANGEASSMAVEVGGGNLSYKNITQTLGEEVIHIGCPGGENLIIGGFGKRSGGCEPDTRVILEGSTTLWGRSFGVREWDIHGNTVLSTARTKRIENAVLCSVKNGLEIPPPPPAEVEALEGGEEVEPTPPEPDVLDLAPILLCNLPSGSIRLESGESLTFNLKRDRGLNMLEGSLRLAAPEGTLCHQLVFPNGNHGKIAVQSATGGELDGKIDLRLVETLVNPDYLIDGLYRGDELESGLYFIDHEDEFFDNRLSSYSQIRGLHLLLSYKPGQMGILLRSNVDQMSSLSLTDYAQRFASAELGSSLMESVSMVQNGLKNSFDNCSTQENMPFLFAIGAHTYQGENEGFGYRNNTYGVALGAHHMTWFKERLRNDAIRIGALAGCLRSKLEFFGENVANGKTARQDIYMLGLIGRYRQLDARNRELTATALVGGLLTRNQLHRRDEEQAAFDAKFNSQSLFANVDGVKNLYSYRQTNFGPWLAANYQFVHQSGYREKGSGAVGAATLGAVDQHIFNFVLGLNAERDLADLIRQNGNLKATLKLGGRYQSSKISTKHRASIEGIGVQPFSPIFTRGDRCACVASASVRDQWDKNWNLSGSWEGVFSSHYTYNNLTFGLEYIF